MDAVWLGLLANAFYKRELGPLLRQHSNGNLDPRILPAILLYALIVLGIILYVVGAKDGWDDADYVRVCIPPLAFVGWTMIQDNTAFDALVDWHSQLRFFIPAVGAILLGALAASLARKADRDSP